MKKADKLSRIRLSLDPPVPEITHWHNMPEIIFAVDGMAEVITNDYSVVLHAEEFLITDSFTLHRIASCTGHVACLLMDYKSFSDQNQADRGLLFSCRPDIDGQKECYYHMRKTLIHLLYFYLSEETDSNLACLSAEHLVFSSLVMDFSYKNDEQGLSLSNISHVQNAVRFMSDHYKEPISVSSVASACHVTDTYLSHLFRKHLGLTPTEFLTRIRLENSLPLLSGKWSLTRIAEETGFPSPRSYNAAFRKEYHMLPAEYRMNLCEIVPSASEIIDAVSGCMQQYRSGDRSEIIVDLPEADLSVRKPWQPAPHIDILHYGIASYLLDPEQKKEVESQQKEFRYSRIYLTSILDSRLVRYMVHGDSILWDFSVLCEILDYVVGLGLKPYLHINSIPDILSPKDASYFGFSNCSIPEDQEKWRGLLRSLFLHLTARYGEEELRTWQVCIWTTHEEMYREENEDGLTETFRFIINSCEAVRSVCLSIAVSGPYMGLSLCRKHLFFLEQYLSFCREKESIPDFLAFRVFAQTSEENRSDGESILKIDISPGFYTSLFDRVMQISEQTVSRRLPCFLSVECGSSFYGDLVNDTCIAASNHMAAMFAASRRLFHLEGILLKDYLLPDTIETEEFIGGLGMLTRHGVPKAIWYADWLFQKLKGDLLYADEHAIITSSGDACCLFLFHPSELRYRILLRTEKGNAFYLHKNVSFLKEKKDGLLIPDPHKRYEAAASGPMIVHIPLSGLTSGTYQKTEYILNREHGSAFDHWVETGGEGPDPDHIAYLKRVVFPLVRKSTITVSEKQIRFERTLEPDEVYLVELVRKKDNNF